MAINNNGLSERLTKIVLNDTAAQQVAAITSTENIIFSVDATGLLLTYQWQVKTVDNGVLAAEWEDVEGATFKHLYKSNIDLTDPKYNGAQFQCIITNDAGTITSAAVTLTINQPTIPTINVQPIDATVSAASLEIGNTVVAKVARAIQ